jgi:N-acetylmuramoyl-L-alanine amidase
MDKLFIVGAGHGGVVQGVSVTDPEKEKFYDHGENGFAIEGFINRNVKGYVVSIGGSSGFNVIDPFRTEMDIPLDLRSQIVNDITLKYGKKNVLYIPLHSNKGKGTGFEIWTSPGDTPADPFASLFAKIFEKKFPGIKIRSDYCDDGKADVDKESKFYELVNTLCPTILPEWLFYDNLKDWLFMKEVHNQFAYAEMIVEFMRQVVALKM